MKKFALGLLVFTLSIFILQARGAAKSPLYFNVKADHENWRADWENEFTLGGLEHFYFSKNEDIDLNILPIEDSLSDSLKKRGESLFFDDLIRGKSVANTLFGLEAPVVIEKSVENKASLQIVNLRSTYKVSDEQFESIERYFLSQGPAVHLELRWKVGTDAARVKEAERLFLAFAPALETEASK